MDLSDRCGALSRKRRRAGLVGEAMLCRMWPLPGKKRCWWHGGASTGPRTAEGKARSLAGRLAGRRRRIAELALEGKKINTGRRGRKPRPVDEQAERDRAAAAAWEARRPLGGAAKARADEALIEQPYDRNAPFEQKLAVAVASKRILRRYAMVMRKRGL
jgi:hypothetical protein